MQGEHERGRALEQPYVLIVNPNSSETITKRMLVAAHTLGAPCVRVGAKTAALGPRYVETAVDEVVAARAVIETVRALREAENPEDPADVYIVGCFSDPGLIALRELTQRPVVGLGESNLLAAHALGSPFGALCNVDADVGPLRELADRTGVGKRLVSVRSADCTIERFDRADPDAIPSLVKAARDAVSLDGARALVLGCAVFTGLASVVESEVHVPVLDPVVTSVFLAAAYACRERVGKAAELANEQEVLR